MPKVSEAYRDARRNQILEAAKRCFLRDGFHETSMQMLFEEAGLSSGAVYRYFGSKEDMVLAIAEESLSEVIAVLHAFATCSHGQALGPSLGNIIEMLERKHAENEWAGIAILSWSESLRNPELSRRAQTLLNPMRKDLTRLVEHLQSDGGLPAGPAPEALASVLMSIVSGFILQLALFDQGPAGSFADAVRSLWPAELT